MTRATKLYSLSSETPWKSVVSATLLTSIMFVVAVLTTNGCAAPVPPATNVVIDDDVRACSPDISDALGPIDVAIVIDTSQSTKRPTGVDLNGDGLIRQYLRGGLVDHGDSRLTAQVEAVRTLVHNAKGRDIRFSIITFAGARVKETVARGSNLSGVTRSSRIRTELTADLPTLDRALDQVSKSGSDGRSIFFTGMHQAIRSLRRSRDGNRRRIVLFMSDSAKSNSMDMDGTIEKVDHRLKNATIIARGQSIVFHTFGLSKDSGEWHKESLGRMAGASGGTYHPVADARVLHCHLASSLLPSTRMLQIGWEREFEKYRKSKASSAPPPG